MKNFYENQSPPRFVTRLLGLKENHVPYDGEVCQKNIQFRAEVIFRVATNSFPVTVMSRRLSFFDKLSAFGRKLIH